MYKLSQEVPNDYWEIESLYDLCFAPGREALSSYRLRDGVEPIAALCLVARDAEGIMSGAIRYWPVCIEDARATWRSLLLGPIAVHPTRQGEGLGHTLMDQSLKIAHAQGWERVLLVGDLPYYARFGFQQASNIHMPRPTNPDRLLVRGLVPDAWEGVGGDVRQVSET